MDKSTLSKFGHVVITVIIIAILLGFTGPGIMFIRDAVMDSVNVITKKLPTDSNPIMPFGYDPSIDYKNLEPGLYETGTDYLLKPWDELIDEGILMVDNGALTLEKSYNAYPDSPAETVSVNSNTTESYQLITEKTLTGYLVVSSDVTTIGSLGFICTLGFTGVVLPETVTTIEYAAFETCNDFSFALLSKNTTVIEEMAFAMCPKLVIVDIPGIVESFGVGPFAGSPNAKITLSAQNEKYAMLDNCLVDTETKTLLQGFASSEIPDDGSVTNIAEGAFYMCTGIKEIYIADCITEIGEMAFGLSENNISSIIVGENNPTYHSAGNCLIVTENKELLLACKNSVIPDDGSVEYFYDYAFLACAGLKSINIPSSVEYFDSYIFTGCSGLTSLTVSADNPTYRSESNCIIEKESGTIVLGCANSIIPEDPSVTSIGYAAFANCIGLKSITIPGNIKVIDEEAFAFCENLVTVTIKDGVEEIRYGAFERCTSLKNINLGNTVTFIGNCAFMETAFTSVKIPASVTELYNNSFKSKADATITIDENNTSYRIDGNCLIEIATGTLVSGYDDFSIPNDGSIKKIGSCAFSGADITSIELPSSITEIETCAFEYCQNLTTITIPNGVTTLYAYTFDSCKSLTSVTLPASIKTIKNYTFCLCDNLKDIYFEGTIAQWNSISFGSYWDAFAESYTVHCSDGDIVK